MGFDDGIIEFNNETDSFYSGQIIRGKLCFQQNKVKVFRGIYVKLKGFCKVHWTTTRQRTTNGRTHSETVTHESYEEYCNYKKYLVGSDSGEYHLQPGSHEFKFEFQLPHNCPASFEGTYGHVRYKFKIVVDRAFKFDQKKEVSLRVVAPLDLNMIHAAKIPMQFEFNDSYCCFCMNNGQCETLVKVPVSGFVPGQSIPIEVSCQNSSNIKIDAIKFSIMKFTTFRAKHHPGTKHGKETIAKLKKGSIPAGTTRNWTLEMSTPLMDVYNMLGCHYIDIDYSFKVSIETPGCHSNNQDSKTIFFGTVPFASPVSGLPSIESLQISDQNDVYPPSPIVNQPLLTAPIGPQVSYTDPNLQYPNKILPYPTSNPQQPANNLTSIHGNPPGWNPDVISPNTKFLTNPPSYQVGSPLDPDSNIPHQNPTSFGNSPSSLRPYFDNDQNAPPPFNPQVLPYSSPSTNDENKISKENLEMAHITSPSTTSPNVTTLGDNNMKENQSEAAVPIDPPYNPNYKFDE